MPDPCLLIPDWGLQASDGMVSGNQNFF